MSSEIYIIKNKFKKKLLLLPFCDHIIMPGTEEGSLPGVVPSIRCGGGKIVKRGGGIPLMLVEGIPKSSCMRHLPGYK